VILSSVSGIRPAFVPASLKLPHDPRVVHEHGVSKIGHLLRPDTLLGRCKLICQSGYALRKCDYVAGELVGDIASITLVCFQGVLHQGYYTEELGPLESPKSSPE